MKNLKSLTLVMLSLVVFNSCQKNELETQTDNTSSEAPEHVVQKFKDLGVNPMGGIEPYTLDGITGWKSHDIFLSKDDIKNMPILPKTESSENEKLFRTRSIVRVPNSGRRTIRVRGRNLPSRMQTGLRRAIANYNNLNLRFRMTVSFGSGNGNANIVVFRNRSNGRGASAGFPRNGNPANRVEIDGGVNQLSLDLIEHIMTHELGHTVGLRHSDFRVRTGCRNSFNEGQTNFGAIFIPGTSRSGRNTNSIMRACYSSNENGEFKSEDRTGLRRIY